MTYREVEDYLCGPGKSGLIRRAQRTVWNFSDADWVVNIALVKVLRKIKESTFKPFESIRQAQSYALTAVDWAVIDYQRTKKNAPHQAFEGEMDDLMDVRPNPREAMEIREGLVGVEEAVEKLPPRQREVWKLRERGGLKFREIGGRLGIHEDRAHSYYWHAKRGLQLLLTPPREDEDMEIKQAEMALKKLKDKRRRRHD